MTRKGRAQADVLRAHLIALCKIHGVSETDALNIAEIGKQCYLKGWQDARPRKKRRSK